MSAVLLLLVALLSCERHSHNVAGIDWVRDYEGALSTSDKSGKPVFIYFSALWCSWCREYEKELERLSGFIKDNFVPLLLDSDRDRELFLRFGGRGTPFTVVLDPRERVLLKFHGSVRAKDLREILSVALQGEVQPADGGEPFVLRVVDRETYRRLLAHFIEDLESRYDETYGGFSSPSDRGSVFKWPTPLTYGYLLERGLMVEEVVFSLKKDIEFLYDPIHGGFFNFYDRTRAYSFYFETSKSLRVNALMITALLKAYRRTGESSFLDSALGTHSYMMSSLFHRGSGCFLNAQVSDPSYYNLTGEKRRKRKPPPTDTALIVEDNAKAIVALLELYRELKEERFVRTASGCVDYILNHLMTEDGLFRYHDIRSGKRGLLNFGRDVSWFSLALLRLSALKPEYGESLEGMLRLRPSYEDWVSRSLRAYVISEVERKKADKLLTGMEVNLSYQNPDNMVFLLITLENLIERDEI